MDLVNWLTEWILYVELWPFPTPKSTGNHVWSWVASQSRICEFVAACAYMLLCVLCLVSDKHVSHLQTANSVNGP